MGDFVRWLAFWLSLAALASGCTPERVEKPEAPRSVVTVCSGCGSEWTSYGPGDREPITKCPTCPMTPEEFEALKDQVRKRLEAERKAKEEGER